MTGSDSMTLSHTVAERIISPPVEQSLLGDCVSLMQFSINMTQTHGTEEPTPFAIIALFHDNGSNMLLAEIVRVDATLLSTSFS